MTTVAATTTITEALRACHVSNDSFFVYIRDPGIIIIVRLDGTGPNKHVDPVADFRAVGCVDIHRLCVFHGKRRSEKGVGDF